MENKEWFKSKTIWAAILIAVLGAYQVATMQTINVDILLKWFAALGLYGLRNAID